MVPQGRGVGDNDDWSSCHHSALRKKRIQTKYVVCAGRIVKGFTDREKNALFVKNSIPIPGP